MLEPSHLEKIARVLRGRVIKNSMISGTPHLGSCLSCIDILVALYWSVLHISPACPNDMKRDRFVLSKGHGAPALFQVLAMKSFFPESWLENYGEDGSLFGEHPLAHGIPGIEAATGSLGHGLPIGVGFALGSKIKNLENHVYVLMSDGECNEGSIWEAALFAAAQKLDNLIGIIDFNKWQATGRSEEVMMLSPLREKWESFGWETMIVDGHDIPLLGSLLSRYTAEGKPTMIIANTVKGKGVSFMEDNNDWHYRIPTQDELQASYKELNIVEENYEKCV